MGRPMCAKPLKLYGPHDKCGKWWLAEEERRRSKRCKSEHIRENVRLSVRTSEQDGEVECGTCACIHGTWAMKVLQGCFYEEMISTGNSACGSEDDNISRNFVVCQSIRFEPTRRCTCEKK